MSDSDLLIYPLAPAPFSFHVSGTRDVTINPLQGLSSPEVTALDGVTSGPGNQGSANAAHMHGQAGTGLGFINVPRSLKRGSTTGIASPAPPAFLSSERLRAIEPDPEPEPRRSHPPPRRRAER